MNEDIFAGTERNGS